jgi:hypothetical protein
MAGLRAAVLALKDEFIRSESSTRRSSSARTARRSSSRHIIHRLPQ